jgi:DNA-binding transcriptional ArsR family regulator
MDVKRLDVAAAEASDRIKALAHPTRLKVVCVLARRECSVTELAETVGAPISSVSQHLAQLRKDRIVKARRARQSVLYSLGDEGIAKFIVVLAEIFCPLTPGKKRKTP